MKDDSLYTRMKSQKSGVESKLKQGNPLMWHRIIMCVCIAFVGIAVIGGIVLDFVLAKQTAAIRHMPVIGIAENAVLPEGEYYIYQAYFDTENRSHYLVSQKQGGVVVSVLPPEGTYEPADILRLVRYDPATYEITVEKDGKWMFQETSVLADIKAKEAAAMAVAKQ